MSSSSDDLARRAAQRLANELDRNLPAAVEAQVRGGAVPQRYEPATAIALAALLISAAKFAWDIYRDLKKDGKTTAAPGTIARRMRLELKIDDNVSTQRRDRIIDVVVDEMMKDPPV